LKKPNSPIRHLHRNETEASTDRRHPTCCGLVFASRLSPELGTVKGPRRWLLIPYRREDGEESERVVRPLGAFFWGKVWTLAAWCELRQDLRTFRLDRMEHIEAGEPFEEEPGRTLRDYLRNIGPYAERLPD
jgi:hypothetical protein